MIKIDVKHEGGIEKAIRALKKKFIKMRIQKELRDRTAYTKPSVQRRGEVGRAAYREKMRSAENK